MPSILDKEIDSKDADEFGHEDFAEALKCLIESKNHFPPYSIGLLGDWGTGKSSIKTIYNSELEGNNERKRKIKIVNFNAWRFGGENIKRALLRQVFLALGGNEELIREKLFRQITQEELKEKTLKEIFSLVITNNATYLFQIAILVLISLILLTLVSFVIIQVIPYITDSWAKAVFMGALGTVFILSLKEIIKTVFDIKNIVVQPFSRITRVQSPSTSSEEYEDYLIEQINLYKQGQVDIENSQECERLVIFIGDLDRLSPEEMVCGIDAIRTFMEIPQGRLPDNFGIIFVISCDQERIAKALSDRTNQEAASDLPNITSLEDARKYIDRIFQFRLDIPPLPRLDMTSFAYKLIEKHVPEVVVDFDENNISVRTLVGKIIHPNVHTPRNALKIINSFIQTWWLAQIRESKEEPQKGVLYKGSITKHPYTLGILCSLKVDFPDFGIAN